MEAARNAREAAPRSPAALSAELSDARLVALCRGGDEDAWSTLVERFSRYVYAIAVQAFRLPEHDAEDVFQEVFARVFERLDTLREDDAVRPWIAQLTRRLCIDRLRAGSREVVADTEELPDGPDEDVLAQIEEASRRDDRQSDLSLPGQTQGCLRGKKRARSRVQRAGDVMSGYDIERLSRLIGMLPPAPAAWTHAARELPRARRELDGIVERAEADAEFRRALIADLESAVRAEGVEPTTWPLLDELRRRVL